MTNILKIYRLHGHSKIAPLYSISSLTCIEKTNPEPSSQVAGDRDLTGWWLQCEAGQSGLGSECLQGQRFHCPVDQQEKGDNNSQPEVSDEYDLWLAKNRII